MTIALPHRRGFLSAVLTPATIVLINAMATKPSAMRKLSYDRFIRTLQAFDVWTKLDAIYLLASHDSAAALINIKNPGTFNATLLLTPTFTTDRGFTTNGTNNAVTLNFNPATAGGSFGRDSAMFAVRVLDTGQLNGSWAGWFGATDGTTLSHRSTTDVANFRLNQAAGSVHTAGSPTISTAAYLLGTNRSASNATQLYANGVAMTVGTSPNQTSTALVSNTLYLGRAASANWAVRQFASCYIGGSLTAPEHAALAAADLAYVQAVGAA